VDIKEYIHAHLIGTMSEKSSRTLTSILIEDIPDIKSLPLDEIDHIINRLIKGEPVQYLTGIAPFYGHFFNVNNDVLIPRPETEELVYTVEKYIKKGNLHTCNILDIGTGSGCIPITLSKLYPKAKITGIDISLGALKVARSNNKRLNTEVEFIALDILDSSIWGQLGDFDIIVSNPPYIPFKEKSVMESTVLEFEPHLALFVENNDALLFYKTILSFANASSKKASIFLECNEFNAQEVAEIFSNDYETAVISDLQGKDRIVQALKKN
jgi:release factor glutamine methyltransferase